MKKFIAKIFLFGVLACLLFAIFIASASHANDPFYLRFTTPLQKNLIIGTSRAAQGIRPDILEKSLNRKFYNFSFTHIHSPFGPSYYHSIKNKLNPDTKNGIFIVTVDPWSISSYNTTPNDTLLFRERNLCVGQTENVTQNPNYQYVIKNSENLFYSLLFDRNSPMTLQKDGWLKVEVPMEKETFNENLKFQIANYKEKKKIANFSKLRVTYLNTLIKFLKNHGKVYLVRLPIAPELFEIEQDLMPNFEKNIQDAIYQAEAYYDFSAFNSNYLYTDGNHLYKTSIPIVTQQIADSIQATP